MSKSFIVSKKENAYEDKSSIPREDVFDDKEHREFSQWFIANEKFFNAIENGDTSIDSKDDMVTKKEG